MQDDSIWKCGGEFLNAFNFLSTHEAEKEHIVFSAAAFLLHNVQIFNHIPTLKFKLGILWEVAEKAAQNIIFKGISEDMSWIVGTINSKNRMGII